MIKITIQIWELAVENNINQEVEHVPGEDNQETGRLSSLYQTDLTESTEWMVNRDHFTYVWSIT